MNYTQSDWLSFCADVQENVPFYWNKIESLLYQKFQGVSIHDLEAVRNRVPKEIFAIEGLFDKMVSVYEELVNG